MDLCPADERSFDQTVQRLANRFAPQPSRIMARSSFHRRLQQSNENPQQIATSLRALAAKCNYNERFRDELLLDRFVAGCTNEKIRERLLLEPDTLTLDQALTLATNIERATAETKALQSNAAQGEAAIQRVHKPRSPGKFSTARSSMQKQRGSCYYCGNQRHKSKQECPAFQHVCKKCNKTGHFEQICWSSMPPAMRPRSPSRKEMSPSGNYEQKGNRSNK